MKTTQLYTDCSKPLYYKSPMKRNESMISTIHLQKNEMFQPLNPLGFQPEQYARQIGSNSKPPSWRVENFPQKMLRVATTQPNIGKTNIHRPWKYDDAWKNTSFPFLSRSLTYFSGVKVESHAPSQPSSNNRDTNIHQWICGFHPT